MLNASTSRPNTLWIHCPIGWTVLKWTSMCTGCMLLCCYVLGKSFLLTLVTVRNDSHVVSDDAIPDSAIALLQLLPS